LNQKPQQVIQSIKRLEEQFANITDLSPPFHALLNSFHIQIQRWFAVSFVLGIKSNSISVENGNIPAKRLIKGANCVESVTNAKTLGCIVCGVFTVHDNVFQQRSHPETCMISFSCVVPPFLFFQYIKIQYFHWLITMHCILHSYSRQS